MFPRWMKGRALMYGRTGSRLLHVMTGLLLVAALCLGAHAGAHAQNEAASPRNIILLIGDGMGFEQVKAAGMFAKGKPGTLFFESFKSKGEVTTHSANADVSDSAATATAMATGRKVNNGVISVALPGDRRPFSTVLEHFKSEGKSTGLVTTAYLTHATPAAFGAHAESRNDYQKIARDYLNASRPNVLFGGMEPTGRGVTPGAARAAGYLVVTLRKGMESLTPAQGTHVAGFFGMGNMPYEWATSSA